MFCVRCGKEAPLVDVLCESCFTAQTSLIQAELMASVTQCRHCGRIKEASGWARRLERRAVEDAALATVRVIPEAENVEVGFQAKQLDRHQWEVTVQAEADVGDAITLEGKATIHVYIHGAACVTCSRRNGGYFESTVQLRGPDRPIRKAEEEQADELVRDQLKDDGTTLDYLLRRSPMHGGVDYVFGSSRLGRRVAKAFEAAFGGEIVETSSIVGRTDGQDLKRFTYLVRIPATAQGSLAKLHGQVVRIERRDARRTIVVDGHDQRTTLTGKQQQALIPIEDQDIRDLEVVYRGDAEVMAIDPETQKTVVLDPTLVKAEAGERTTCVYLEGTWVPAP